MAVKLTGQKFTTIDANGNRLINIADGITSSDASNINQLSGSNIWQESLELTYNSGQRVSDFLVQFQGRVTTNVIESIGGANIYDFDFDVFEKPTGETDQVYFQRFSINPVSGVEIIQVIDVQRNTPNTGQTRITLQPPINSNFTLTYPPTNFGAPVGAAVREYTRRPIGLNPAPTNPTPAEKLELRPSTAEFALDVSLGSYVSDYWILELINGITWRPFQTYVEGDEVEYVDSQGVARHVICQEAHTSSAATNPILSSSISHTGTGFSADVTPWAPVGSAIDLSTGTFEAAVQILGSDGNAAIALNGGSVLNEDRWFINVGQGTSAIELPDAQLPAVGDLISFGTGNAGTTEEFRVAARNDDGNTSLRFDGTFPAEVEALVDDRVENPVNLFNAGLRTDFGQVDRLVFDPSDFAVNTEAQDIGHAHVSVIGKQNTLPFLGTYHLWTGEGGGVPAAVSVDTLGYTRREDATHEFATRNAFETDSGREYDEGEIYYVIDYDGAGTPAAFEVTTAGTGYGTGAIVDGDNTARFATRTLDTQIIQNIVENGSSTTRGAAGAWSTTESWQRANFALKGESSGINVVGTFPTSPSIGDQIFLDPANNALTEDDNHGNARPRGLYAYIQPSSNPNTAFWEELTIPEIGQLYNDARVGDVIYLTSDETNFNGLGVDHPAGFYRASVTDANAPFHTTWIAVGGGGGSVEVNGTAVTDADFRSHPEAATYLYSPPFQSDANTTTGDTDVSVQVDTREIGNALGIDSLQAQVHQIEEELSQTTSYTWVDEQVFIDVFITNRTNSSGTLNQATILQPHFVDNSNIFTTYAVLTGDADTGLRNQWNGFNSNAQGIIVGLGPDDTDLVAFQLLSTYYRDSTAAGLAEIRLKMIDPDGDFAGPSRVGTNTNKQQFISWISGNDNPITTADPNPVIHQGISTYYYETDNDFLDTVRHDVGNHITGSALTADERVIVDNLAGITMPGGDNVITLGQYDSGGGGIENKGDWYWRNAQSGPAQVTFSSTPVWSDLVNTSAANPTELHVLMLEAETGDEDKLNAIRTTIGVRRSNTDTTQLEDNELGLLYVAHDNLNWAILEVASSPADTGNNDVRFWINRVVESQGAPKTAATNPNTLSLTISDVGVTVGAYVGDLTVDGDLSVTGTTNNANSNAIAYVAIQFTSIFAGIRGVTTDPVTPQNATIADTGAPGGSSLYTYIEYTALFGGNRITMVDRVRISDGLTLTRRFTEAAPAAFTAGTDVPQE